MSMFTVSPGSFSALANRNDRRAYYTFSGDLGQLGTIFETLTSAGFPVVKSDVYPGFPENQEEEYKKALAYLYQNRTPGWWMQRSDLKKYGICTEIEFDTALAEEVKRSA